MFYCCFCYLKDENCTCLTIRNQQNVYWVWYTIAYSKSVWCQFCLLCIIIRNTLILYATGWRKWKKWGGKWGDWIFFRSSNSRWFSIDFMHYLTILVFLIFIFIWKLSIPLSENGVSFTLNLFQDGYSIGKPSEVCWK